MPMPHHPPTLSPSTPPTSATGVRWGTGANHTDRAERAPTRPLTHATRATLIGCVLALATGCASVMRVDSDVEIHANWPSGALSAGIVSYQFERLPSQSSGPAAVAQTELEALARTVLATKGWQLAAAAPTPHHAPWRVQVAASQSTLPRAPWEEPTLGGWPRWSLGASNAGLGLGLGWGGSRGDMPYHQRSVSVVVRSGATGLVAFETQASHDGRWNGSPAVWQAMLEAALTGFPQPPASALPTQRIDIDVPR